jgi:magnesium-protoporphyrin IX monomethyl ester (oxidative) cyclase
LGLQYIASYIREKGYDVDILDCTLEDYKNKYVRPDYSIYHGLEVPKIVERVKDINPNIVGVTIPFNNLWASSRAMIKAIKDELPHTPIVVGGAFPCVRPVLCLEKSYIDYVIIGDGEKPFFELLQHLEGKKQLRDIGSIGYKVGGRYVLTEPTVLPDINSLPYPARDIIPIQKYWQASRDGFADVRNKNKRYVTMITSRGCPFGCTFCSIHQIMGKKWRPRSVENIIGEMRELKDKYNVEQIEINDDNFSMDMKRADKLLDAMIEEDFGFEWSCGNGIRADRLNKETMIKMKKAGCFELRVAPESGCQRVIDELMHKKMKLETVEKVIRWAKEIDLDVSAFTLYGMPGETKAEMLKTLEYAVKLKQMGAHTVLSSIVVPLFGTQVYEWAEDGGYLKSYDPADQFPWHSIIETEEFTKADVEKMRNAGMLSISRMGGYV